MCQFLDSEELLGNVVITGLGLGHLERRSPGQPVLSFPFVRGGNTRGAVTKYNLLEIVYLEDLLLITIV